MSLMLECNKHLPYWAKDGTLQQNFMFVAHVLTMFITQKATQNKRHRKEHIQATSQASIAKDLSDRSGTLSQIHPTSSQENHHGRKPTA